MPVYEYRCNNCTQTSSFFVRTYGGSPGSGCNSCQSLDLQRIISTISYIRSESDKMSQLDPKYGKLVDRALSKAPRDTNPEHYVDKMVPFSQAKESGEPYFKE